MKFKKIMALALSLTLLCTVFTACGGENSSASTPSASSGSGGQGSSEDSEAVVSSTGTGEEVQLFQPKTVDGAKAITLNAAMEPTGLNTLTATYSIEFTMFRHLYEPLYKLDEENVPQPAAAETVDVSEDGLTYTFHLRDDGKWTNGDPVTAQDFEFAWQQALSPEVASDYGYFLYFIKNAEAYFGGKAEWSDVGVKVLDDKTLEVSLEKPTPYAPFLFSFGTLCPINQQFYEAVGADKYNTEAEYFCTNGPFALTEWAHDSQIVMQKNDGWHGADGIEVEQINWRIITDQQAALTSFLSGELDMVDVSTGELIKQAEAQNYEVQSFVDGSSFYVYFNHKDQYLQNENLRKALALAYDKRGLIDAVYQNNNAPMTSFVSPAVAGINNSSFAEALAAKVGGELSPTNGDVAKAKEYLAKALEELGCTVEDLSAHLSVDCGDSATSQAEAAFYQNQWLENLGIDVTINPMITKQGSANRKNGNYVMSLTGWGPDYNDPMTFLDLWVTNGGNNQTGFSDAEYDELIAKATTETDLEKRQDYFYRCEEILAEKLPVAHSWWRTQSYIVNTDKIKGGLIRQVFQPITALNVKLS